MATQATTKARELENDRRTKAYHLLEALYAVALDKNESTQSRVSAAKTYLSKTMPDLKAIELTGEVDLQITAIEIKVLDDSPGAGS